MLKIRRSPDRLIFNTGSPILVIRHLFIETVPSLEFLVTNGFDHQSMTKSCIALIVPFQLV